MKRIICIISFLCPVLIAGCSGADVKETLGLGRAGPDEFRVVSRPPLSVPPEFTLRPPLPGEDVSAGLASDALARSMVTGTQASYSDNQLPTGGDTAVAPVSSSPLSTNAESELLSRMGAGSADAGIREKLYQDSVTLPKEEESWVDAVNPFAKSKDNVIDPEAEARTLQQQNTRTTGGNFLSDGKKDAPLAEPKEAGEKPKAPAADDDVIIVPDDNDAKKPQ